MIELRDVIIKYGNERKLGPLNARFQNNTIIIGHNGAGKTSVARAICDVVKYDGQIKISNEGKNLEHVDCASNLEELYAPASTPSEAVKLFSSYSSLNPSIFNKYMEMASLGDLIIHPFNSMSQGQKKFVFLSLSLSFESLHLIADEPFENLDPGMKSLALKMLGMGNSLTIIITHEMKLLKNFEGWDLFVLSEGTFYGPVSVKDFIRCKSVRGKHSESIMTVRRHGDYTSFVPCGHENEDLMGSIDDLF
mgnify:CR=1 FL=1